jgi:solute:Na+ symporter, SSS family
MALIDNLIVIAYLLGMVIVGVVLQKKASAGIDSYFLADRGLPWWALGASGMASNLDVSGTMINTAFVFALGAMGMFIEIRGGVTLIMAFLMIFMGKWNRRAQVMTMAEWMSFRFGKDRQGNVSRLIAAISIIIVTIAMITYFAVGSGKFIDTFLGIPNLGVVTEKLDLSEQNNVANLLVEMDNQRTSVTNSAKDVKEITLETKALNRAWDELNARWTNVENRPENVDALYRFDKKLSDYHTSVKALKMTLDKKATTYPENVIQSITATIAGLDGALKNTIQYFEESAKYKVILKSDLLAALGMIIVCMLYTVISGLYGVVWTDVFQAVLIFAAIVYMCFLAFAKYPLPETFSVAVPMRDGTFQAIQTTRDAWTSIVPPWKLDFPADSMYSIYTLFGIAIMFYLIKVTIEGSGGTSGYMIQRYFAARSDREAGYLSLFWIFLLSFRWPFIAAIAILGVSYGVSQGVVTDPETVLPVVVSKMAPMGMKGLLVAGLMAAAMSTFSPTVNAGAAYWVKDIYQAFINPKATEKQLMRHSHWASIVIVILGLLFSMAIKNINEIWGWITMSIGAGMIVPTLVRWYWWRMNGYGFAIGTVAGMIAAVIQRLWFPNVPEYVAFSFAASISFVAMIIATYASKPTDEKVLYEFYKTTRPFGFWAHIRAKLPANILEKVNKENRRDIISIFMAVPWQVVLFLTWMMVVMKNWHSFGWLLLTLTALSIGLYFVWFRHLSTEVKMDESPK